MKRNVRQFLMKWSSPDPEPGLAVADAVGYLTIVEGETLFVSEFWRHCNLWESSLSSWVEFYYCEWLSKGCVRIGREGFEIASSSSMIWGIITRDLWRRTARPTWKGSPPWCPTVKPGVGAVDSELWWDSEAVGCEEWEEGGVWRIKQWGEVGRGTSILIINWGIAQWV